MKIECIASPTGVFLRFGQQQGGAAALVNIANIVAIVDNDGYTQIEMGNSKYVTPSPIADFIAALSGGRSSAPVPAAKMERIASGAGTFIGFASRGGRHRTVLVNVANILAIEDRGSYTAIATFEETTYLYDGPFNEVLAAITGPCGD